MTEELKRLLSCLGKLDPEKQRIVLLAYYSGWSREQLSHQARYSGEHDQDMVASQPARNSRVYGTLIDGTSAVMYDDAQDALAAEYVLGTLSADEREHAEALLTLDPGFAASVRMWERRLGELNVMVEAVEPPPELWDKIKAELGVVEPASEVPPAAPGVGCARVAGRNAAGNTARRIAAADHGGRAGH